MSLENLGHMQWAAMEGAVLGGIVKGGRETKQAVLEYASMAGARFKAAGEGSGTDQVRRMCTSLALPTLTRCHVAGSSNSRRTAAMSTRARFCRRDIQLTRLTLYLFYGK